MLRVATDDEIRAVADTLVFIMETYKDVEFPGQRTVNCLAPMLLAGIVSNSQGQLRELDAYAEVCLRQSLKHLPDPVLNTAVQAVMMCEQSRVDEKNECLIL